MYELDKNNRYTIVNGSLPIPGTYNSTLKKLLMPIRMETRSKNSVGLIGTICDRFPVSQYAYKFHKTHMQYVHAVLSQASIAIDPLFSEIFGENESLATELFLARRYHPLFFYVGLKFTWKCGVITILDLLQ